MHMLPRGWMLLLLAQGRLFRTALAPTPYVSRFVGDFIGHASAIYDNGYGAADAKPVGYESWPFPECIPPST